MKIVRTRSKQPLINIRGLVLIYLLLCILSVVFARTAVSGVLADGRLPEDISLVIFLTIPAVLLLFLTFSVQSLVRDALDRRNGSRFQARLLGYFALTMFFAAVPNTVITLQLVYELVRFGQSIRVTEALQEAQKLSMDNYSFKLEKLEALIRERDFDSFMAAAGGEAAGRDGPLEAGAIPEGFPEDLAAVQDFRLQEDGSWIGEGFAGRRQAELRSPPGMYQGFVSREIPRDTDIIRYITYPERNLLRVISCNLGEGFDGSIELISAESARFTMVNSLKTNLRPLLGFYFGIFIFPTLLMTIIIAVSFASRITQPLTDLTEATRRVSEGDYSIQILSHAEDEVGILIRSFNAMVQDLEKSRMALIRTETISIWQDLAQQLAHEIKNPLTPIRLTAERVLRRWRNSPERIGEILENSMLGIVQEVIGLDNLLTQFRTLARPMEPSLSWTCLRDLAEETILSYRTSYPEVRFDIDQIQPDLSVKIDRRNFPQVLTNLIINGIDAMDGRGFIKIRTDLVKKREMRYCRLSIQDSGKGISEEEGAHIFTPYFTTKESGTGLGLPIVERIVTDHGGSIWFNSAVGVGTTFFIDLPIGESGASVPAGV
ncbi:MAG: HAMP domain-containing protein [Spirochaetaceae bacterium]|jgi:nitrogen fixation/metabolism regulation signal transduction histidine kinase|nr:HAMP domain-containing protein [Spirochaetaceae bacterium]